MEKNRKFQLIFVLTLFLFYIPNVTSVGSKGIAIVIDSKLIYGTEASQASNDASLTPTSPAPSPMGINYHKGPVMSSPVTAYAIWYGNWKNNGLNNPTAVMILRDLIQNIGSTNYYKINTNYTGGNPALPVTSTVTWGGEYNDTAYSLGKSLTDVQISTIVTNTITAGHFPYNTDGIYFLFTSSDVSLTSGFCTQYCGFHSNTSNGDIKYAVVGNPSNCMSSCASQTISPNGNAAADAMASIVGHEFSEMVTDPNLNAWYDFRGAENADKCSWNYGATTTMTGGARWNVACGARKYLLQQIWGVNGSTGKCSLS